MSPRRSSRARTTQPSAGVATAPSTSSSSVSSARTDRAPRASQKQSSPHKSLTPHSLSSEEPEEPVRGPQVEPPLTRRRTREQDNDEGQAAKLDEELDDDMAEEDEITRCICGFQEYPGPPSDAGKSSSAPTDPDAQGDDLGGLFIQCDICKVWQHGGCVGIMDEAASPDEYFCEECRKDLHRLSTSLKGQKYSRYLPVYEQQHGKNRKSSVSKDTERHSSRDKDRNARASVDSFGKRRSTMNSRAAYDEDEVLKKVLEESKHDGAPTSEDGIRKKRSREDSEENPEVKRQRTGSRSPSGSPVIESEDDSTKASIPKQKPRGAAARSQREKEQRDKDREKERAEAASRRKGRAERRKGDDPEETEPTPTPADDEPARPESKSESIPPEAPPVESRPTSAPRRGGRPPQKSRGRLGRNQYSREPCPTTNGTPPATDTPQSPQPASAATTVTANNTSSATATNGISNGHDSSDGTTTTTTTTATATTTAAGNKAAKSKHWRLQKLSWNDIRRPAGAMQNFIAQRQVELANERPQAAPAVQPAGTPTSASTSLGAGARAASVNGEESRPTTAASAAAVVVVGKDRPPEREADHEKEKEREAEVDLARFKDLSTTQMMDYLSRDLVHWQRVIAQAAGGGGEK